MLCCLFVTFCFGQDIVCAWTFDGITGANSGASNTEKVIAANTEWGAGTFYADGTNGSDDLNNGESPEINAFGGNVLNDPRTNPSASQAVAIANTTSNGKSVVFKFSMSGYQNLQLSYAQRGTATGHNTETWSYSTDGVNFTEVESITGTNVTTFTLREVSFSGAAALNDAAVVYIRLTLNGCTSGSGNNRIDNVVFRANASGPDVYAPVITSVSVENATTLKLNFNEDLDAATAQNTANYEMNAETFTAATLAGNVVTLTVSPALAEGLSYSLMVSNVADVAGNVMTPDTLTFTFGVDQEFQVANIAALRAKWTDELDINNTHFGNDVYKLTGHVIVTGINDSYRHQIFIQDETGAIVIDDPNNKITSALESGDEITDIYGTLTDYYGLLQFAVSETYTASALSIYNDVTPLTVTLAELQNVSYMNAHQCELLRMEDVVINPLSSSSIFENGKKYTLTQNGQTGNGLWTHFYNIEGLTGEAIPTSATNLTGVNKISYGEYFLIPRVAADLGTGLPQYLTENDIVVYPNPVSDQLTVSLRTDAFQVTNMAVYDINGKLVHTQAVNDNQIEMSTRELASGNYFLRLSDGKNSVTTKFVKR